MNKYSLQFMRHGLPIHHECLLSNLHWTSLSCSLCCNQMHNSCIKINNWSWWLTLVMPEPWIELSFIIDCLIPSLLLSVVYLKSCLHGSWVKPTSTNLYSHVIKHSTLFEMAGPTNQNIHTTSQPCVANNNEWFSLFWKSNTSYDTK